MHDFGLQKNFPQVHCKLDEILTSIDGPYFWQTYSDPDLILVCSVRLLQEHVDESQIFWCEQVEDIFEILAQIKGQCIAQWYLANLLELLAALVGPVVEDGMVRVACYMPARTAQLIYGRRTGKVYIEVTRNDVAVADSYEFSGETDIIVTLRRFRNLTRGLYDRRLIREMILVLLVVVHDWEFNRTGRRLLPMN